MASNLAIVTFDDMETAAKAHKALVDAMKHGLITIDDVAELVKDEEGEVLVNDQVSRGTQTTSAVGGAAGLLAGSMVGGVVVGLAGGTLAGRSAGLGIDDKFVDEVSEQVQPGTSAIFILAKDANKAAILALLREYEGHLLQTTLDRETEEAIRKALGDNG